MQIIPKKTKTEAVLQIIKRFARNFSWFNSFENTFLTEEFSEAVISIKEKNSQIVWDAYYLPKAINTILKEEGYLTTVQGALPRAKAMLLADMASGVLDEFYRFKE